MYKNGNTGKTVNRFFRRYMKMHFIGIFSNHSKFDIIKQNVEKTLKRKDLKLIHIHAKNLENIKNIVFETIIITNEIHIKNEEEEKIICKLWNNCTYLIINTDICANMKIISNKEINCITYGLNQKSTITISSVQDEKAILYIQRNIKNIENHKIEMGELSIDLKTYKHVEIEDLLATFSICLIYNSIEKPSFETDEQ